MSNLLRFFVAGFLSLLIIPVTIFIALLLVMPFSDSQIVYKFGNYENINSKVLSSVDFSTGEILDDSTDENLVKSSTYSESSGPSATNTINISTEFQAEDIDKAVIAVFDKYLQNGFFVGQKGEKGEKGDPGEKGLTGPAGSGGGYTVVPPNPSSNFFGATLFAITDLSSTRFTTTNATVQNNLTVTNNLTVAGTISGDFSELGIGTTSIDSSAILQADSTTRGFLAPRMTTVQRDAISSPAAGLLIYNTSTSALNVYNGSWGSVGGGMSVGGSVSGATEGSVFFAGASGVLAQDNSNFFWDDTTNRLGIGKTNPATALDIAGDLTIAGDDLFMATNTSGFILVADGTNYNPVAMSGDITIDSTGATSIGADKVTEADLKAVDAAGDEECLTYESTVGDFEWQSCGSSLAIGSAITSGSVNTILYSDSSGNLAQTATGGVGTLCLVSANGGVPSFGACSGSAATAWSSLTAPSGNLSVAHAANTTTMTFNSVTTGSAWTKSSTSLTTGKLLDLQVSGTAAAASQTALNILTAGANATNAITTYGAQISNTHTNATSGTNIGLYLNASGATTANYALIVNSGRVGLGTTAPDSSLDVYSGSSDTQATWSSGTLPYGTEKADLILARRHASASDSGLGYAGPMIDFRAINGVSAEWSVAQIIASVDPSSGSNYQGGLSFLTSGGGTTDPTGRRTTGAAPTVRMTINQNGNVGIGTTNPATKLQVVGASNFYIGSAGTTQSYTNMHVAATDDPVISIEDVGQGVGYFAQDGTTTIVGAETNFAIKLAPTFATGPAASGTNYFYLTSTGLLGIGSNVTSPQAEVDITRTSSGAMGAVLGINNHGSGANTASAIRFGVDSSSIADGSPNAEIKALNSGSSDATSLIFGTWNGSGFGEKMRIHSDGNIGIGADSTPDSLFSVGSTSQFQVNSSGAIAAVVGITSSSNYVQSAGTFSLTSANTTQVTTASAAAFNLNSLTTGTGFYAASSSLTSGKLIDLQISGTTKALTNQTALNIATAGSNNGASQTTYGIQVANTHTGTTAVNVGLLVSASGGTDNYAAIFSAGNVGIGTTTPSYPLHVVLGAAGVVARFTDTDGSCDIDPTSTALVCSSDQRLKKDVATIESALEKVLQFRGVNFKWNSQTDDALRIGFIAQEVESIVPELVKTDFQTGYKSVNYTGFVPIIVNAIKEQQNTIDSLQVSVNYLQGNLNGNISAPIIIKGHLYLTSDSVGQAKILAGSKTVRINFTKPYEYQPIVTISPRGENPLNNNFRYTVIEEDELGFTIKISSLQNEDVEFSWHAFASEGAKLTVSDGSTQDIVLVKINQNEDVVVEEEVTVEEGQVAGDSTTEPPSQEEVLPTEEFFVGEPEAQTEPVTEPAEGNISEPVAETPQEKTLTEEKTSLEEATN